MNTHPINLAVRLLLEIAMLVILGYWGGHLSGGWVRYIGMIGIPVTAAALWGLFRIPDDPRPAPIKVPGLVRLLLEWGLFSLSVWALYDL